MVSIPLDGNKNPPKDEFNEEFSLVESDDVGKHKLQKRLDIASSSYALAEKEEREKEREKKNHHLEKRDTTPKNPDQIPPTSIQNERKTRDVSGEKDQPDTSKKDQHRNVRDTQKKDEKPKREVPDPNTHDPRTQQQPPKPIQKRDTTKDDGSTQDPKKHIDTHDDEHTRHTRSTQEPPTEKKIPESTQRKPITKRETKEENIGKDAKQTKDTKQH